MSSYNEFRKRSNLERSDFFPNEVSNQESQNTESQYFLQEVSERPIERSTKKLIEKPTEKIIAKEVEKSPLESPLSEMIMIWNEVFQYSLKPIKGYISKTTAKKLQKLYHSIFNCNLDHWRDYAIKVNSSKFLMGEKITKNNFKATFNWLLNEETAVKIMNGEYGVGDRELDQNNILRNIEEVEKELVNEVTKKITNHTKNNISLEESEQEFKSYIKAKKYLGDGDPYDMKCYFGDYGNAFWSSCAYDRLFDHELKLFKSLRDSYILKKQVGSTSIETKQLIKEMLSKFSIRTKGIELLNKLKSSKETIEKMDTNIIAMSIPSLLWQVSEAA